MVTERMLSHGNREDAAKVMCGNREDAAKVMCGNREDASPGNSLMMAVLIGHLRLF